MSISTPTIAGTIRAWSSTDSVGRIELSTGEWVRFGGTACRFVPAIGLRVVVGELAPHPLGGHRARVVTLVDPCDADRILDETRPLVGTSASPEANALFADAVNAVGLLGILLRDRLTSRADVRAWFERAGVEIQFEELREVPASAGVVHAGGAEYRVFLCTRDLPAGKGFLSFGTRPLSIARDRELALYAAETGGPRVDRLPALAPLVELVARCAASEVAITAHQSINHFMNAEAWTLAEPLHRWASSARHQDGHILLSGMAALHLPDLWGPLAIEPQIFEAAEALVSLGRRPEVGAKLGPCRVADALIDWIQLEPA